MKKIIRNILRKPLAIWCVLFGHTYFITSFFGYQYCGRCNDQIGDTLGGFGVRGVIGVDEYHKKNCEDCNKVRRSWKGINKIIMPIIEKFYRLYNL